MIINRVTQAREERGISKAHLARRLKVSRAYVTRLEQNRLRPSADVMLRLVEYFKKPVGELFQRVEGPANRDSDARP